MSRLPIAAIVGPTASGKTALAVELALRLNGEVVSADSMQIYRHMDIATAKPTAEERRGVPHHLIGCVDPAEDFSVARYCDMARPLIADIAARGRLPILAGGTGLYVDALLTNTLFREQETDPALRREISERLQQRGIDAMLEEIRAFDPLSADRLAPERNPKRIVRCIEVYRATGLTQTQLNEEQKRHPSPYRAVKIGLCCRDRERLYDRINRRVDVMLERGLVDEARAFYDGALGVTAAAAIGYKELLPYLRGEQSLDQCAEVLKRSTRRYAKRQLTWFKRDREIHWFEIDEMSFSQILASSIELIQRTLQDEQV